MCRRWLLVAVLGFGLGAACERRENPPEFGLESVESARPGSTAQAQRLMEPPPVRGGCPAPQSTRSPPVVAPATSCPHPEAADVAPSLPRARVAFLDAPNTPTVDVEVATTPMTRQRGLMYRTDLGSDAGMLFAFDDDQVRTFWMHDTCLPLDMLFIDRDLRIVGILEQVPVLNDSPRSIPCPARFVLEVHAGYTRERGIFSGQRLSLQPL